LSHSKVKKNKNFQMATWDNSLPTDEELTTEEINLSSAALRAGAFHLGKYCEHQNNVSV
jgi:NADH dehydrogenase (ubiquinone) 1 alpha subcomplex subunit 8